MNGKELNRLLGIALLTIGILQTFSCFLIITQFKALSNKNEAVSIENPVDFSKVEPVIWDGKDGIFEKPRNINKGSKIPNYFILFIIFNLITGIVSITAGFGILKLKAFGKQIGLIASVLSLFNAPVGTLIGIFGIWFLTGKSCKELYLKDEAIEENSIL